MLSVCVGRGGEVGCAAGEGGSEGSERTQYAWMIVGVWLCAQGPNPQHHTAHSAPASRTSTPPHTPITPMQIKTASWLSGVSTASMGKFDRKLPGEKEGERKLPGKRRKFSGVTDAASDRALMSKTADKLLRQHADDVLDINKAIGKFEAAARQERHVAKQAAGGGDAGGRSSGGRKKGGGGGGKGGRGGAAAGGGGKGGKGGGKGRGGGGKGGAAAGGGGKQLKARGGVSKKGGGGGKRGGR